MYSLYGLREVEGFRVWDSNVVPVLGLFWFFGIGLPSKTEEEPLRGL